MDTIKTLKGEKFQLKSTTKLMEALDVHDEGLKSVWNKNMKITEMVVASNEDEYDVLLCNTEKNGVIMTTVHGGYGMFNSCLVQLQGKSLVAAFDRDEILYLFAIHENKVWHVKEQMPHSGKFTEAESVPFVHPLNFLRVEKLLILPFEKEKGFVLGVVTETTDMKNFWVSYEEWNTNTIPRLIPSSFSSPILAFSSKTMEELNVECASATYLNSLGIRYNGDIVGCLSIREPQFTEGNIRARSVIDIWNDPNSFAWCRHFSLDKMTGFCKTCVYAEKCLGGCANMRLCTKGSIY